MKFLRKYRKYFFENIGLSLFAFNLVLLAVVFFLYDPFGIIPGGYEGSSPLLEVTQKNVQKITFETSENTFDLIRKEKIENIKADRSDLAVKTDEATAFFEDKKEEKFEWSLKYKSGDSAESSYQADPDRVADLFLAIQEGRRYYSFPRNPENESEMGFSKTESGICECLKITFFDGKDQHSLYVGRSTPGGESHVRLDDESRIYLLRNDIQSSAGYGRQDHFRNRRLLPRNITAEYMSSIYAKFSEASRNVELSKAGGMWRIIRPVNGAARMGTLPEDIADMKADQFPKMVPADINTEDAFRLEIVYKKNFTDIETIAFDVLGSKEHDIYFIKNREGIIYQVYSTSFKDFYHPEENLLEKESLLEEKH